MRYLLPLLCVCLSCSPAIPIHWDGNPAPSQILESYKNYITDAEMEAITQHFISAGGDPDAYGHILMDSFSPEYGGFEFGVDVYKDNGGQYVYEWDLVTGRETKRYLSAAQAKFTIKI